ncbi:MAG: ComF family protein [Desulfatiglandaceae bacterium]
MNLLSGFIDLIYPPRCQVCNQFLIRGRTGRKPGSPICPSCTEGFRRLTHPRCIICARPFEPGAGENHLCGSCLGKRPLFQAIEAPYLYEGSLKTVIHRFKYGERSGLAGFLGPLLASFAKDRGLGAEHPLVMPIPLHPRRLRERGFNQSKLLSEHLAKELSAELDFLSLRRIRYTLPQTGLGKHERRKNVRGAFRLQDSRRVSGRTVFLVDDVATTGNTLNACAKTLLKGGVDKVLCLVLARTAHPGF